jgi:fibronectin-binding autotransporter adhesin
MKIRLLSAFIGIVLLVSSRVEAQTTTFTAGSGVWSNSGNWSNGTPIVGSDVNFTTTATSTVDGAFSMANLNFSGGVQVVNSSSGSLNVSGTISYSGGGPVSINVPISGTGNLWLNGGTGGLTLNPGPGANTYSGTTQVFAGGTLSDGEVNSYSPNSILYVGSATPSTVLVNFNESIAALADVGGGPGSVIIASGATLDMVGGYSGTFSGVISGAGNVQKDVTGTLTLVGANTYTGTTVINGAGGTGILLGNGTTLGSLASSGVSGTGTLGFNEPSSYTYAGILSGALQVVQQGPGTVVLSGTNTNSGAITINGGTLQAGSTTAFGNSAQSLAVNGSGTLDLNGFNISIASIQSNTALGTVALNGGATLTLTNTSASTNLSGAVIGTGSLNTSEFSLNVTSSSNTYSGGTTITAGTLIANNSNPADSATGTGPITIMPGGALLLGQNTATGYINPGSSITDNGALQFFRMDGSPYVFTNNISGIGTVSQNSAGGLTVLSGTNTYSGVTTVFQGTLFAGSTSAFGGASGKSQISFTNDGILDLNGNNNTVGSIIGTATTGGISLGANTLTTNDTVGGGTFAAVISGTGGSMVFGNNSTILTGANTYTGGTSITFGTVLVANSTGSGLGTGPISISPGAILDFGASSTTGSVSTATITDNGTINFNRIDMPTESFVIAGSGSVGVNAGGVILTGNNTYTGGSTISSGTEIQIGDGLTVGSRIAGNVSDAGTLQFAPASSDSYNFSGNITGSGGVTLAGPGSIALTGANTYTGLTSVNAGTLSDGSPGSFSPNSKMLVNSAGGSLMVNFNEAVANLENGGTGGPVDIVSTSASLASLGQAYSGDFMGNISGAGSFIVAGGQQGLGGNNTYSGGTIVTGGALLWVSSNNALGTGTVAFSGGSDFSPDASVTLPNDILLVGGENLENDLGGSTDNMTLNGVISETGGVGSIEWCTPATLTLNGTNTFTGGVDMREGTLVLGNNSGAGTGTITLDTATSLNVVSGVTASNFINFSGGTATLTGSGTIASPINAGASVIISPMNSATGGPGTLTFSSGLTFAPGAAVHFDLYDTTGAAGTGYGLISATGGLDFTATANSITFNVVTTNAVGTAANALNFNPATPYSWMFTTSTAAITGFNPNEFNIVQSGFLNATGGGSFDVSMTGNNLYLNFTPVPEPSTWCLIGAGLAAIVPFALRRRRLAKA